MTKRIANRRQFLKTSAVGAAAGLSLPLWIPSEVLGGDGQPGANEKIRVGIIGLGGRAGQIAETCDDVPSIDIAAVCDCYGPRIGPFVQSVGKGRDWKTYEDFRRMIEVEKLDGVMVRHGSHVDDLADVEIPVREKMQNRSLIRSHPRGLKKIVDILRESGGIDQSEEGGFALIRSRLADIIDARPDKLPQRKGSRLV